jgi:hypothetical protein
MSMKPEKKGRLASHIVDFTIRSSIKINTPALERSYAPLLKTLSKRIDRAGYFIEMAAASDPLKSGISCHGPGGFSGNSVDRQLNYTTASQHNVGPHSPRVSEASPTDQASEIASLTSQFELKDRPFVQSIEWNASPPKPMTKLVRSSSFQAELRQMCKDHAAAQSKYVQSTAPKPLPPSIAVTGVPQVVQIAEVEA